jgi:hypothetical protein
MTGGKVGAFGISPHVLTDGGVYDNTGFESAALLDKERQRNAAKLSDLILVSDAGSPFQWSQDGEFRNPIALAFRASEVIMNRVAEETLRRIASDVRVGLISIDQIDEQAGLAPMIQRSVSRIRTDLDRFSDVEVAALVKHGEDKAIRQLVGRFEIDLESSATTVNEFPICLPSSNEVLAKALRKSGKVHWWNSFTNFSDISTYIIIAIPLIITLYSVPLFAILANLTALPQPGNKALPPAGNTALPSAGNAVIQSAPIIGPLPPNQSSIRPTILTPQVNQGPTVDLTQVNRCLDTIDRANLSVAQVESLARQCLQSR